MHASLLTLETSKECERDLRGVVINCLREGKPPYIQKKKIWARCSKAFAYVYKSMPVASAWTQTRIGSLDTVTCRLDEFAGPYNSPFLPIKRFLAIQGNGQYFSTLLYEGLEGHKELAQFEAMERGAQMRKIRVVKFARHGDQYRRFTKQVAGNRRRICAASRT